MSMNPASLLALTGKVALVTGASGGIGSAVAELLADAGADVLSVDLPGRNPPPGTSSLPCDLSDRVDVHRLGDKLGNEHPRLDIFVHCAGASAARPTTPPARRASLPWARPRPASSAASAFGSTPSPRA